MSSEIAQRIDDMMTIVQLKLKGHSVPQIVKITGFTRGRVLDHLDEYAKWAKEQQDVMGRAREMLASVDEHYNMIIKDLWDTVEDAKSNGENGIRVQALKTLAGTEKDRAAMFQQAGLNDQSLLADEMRETERKHDVLIKILREVSYKCPRCKVEVAKRLAEATGKSEVIVEVDTETPAIE